MRGTIFMNNLIRGDIDSVDLVRRLTFNVPVINLPRCPSNFSQHECSHLICSSTSIPVLKTKILAHLL